MTTTETVAGTRKPRRTVRTSPRDSPSRADRRPRRARADTEPAQRRAARRCAVEVTTHVAPPRRPKWPMLTVSSPAPASGATALRHDPTPAEGERGTQQGGLAQSPAHEVARREGPGPEADQVDEGDGERDARRDHEEPGSLTAQPGPRHTPRVGGEPVQETAHDEGTETGAQTGEDRPPAGELEEVGVRLARAGRLHLALDAEGEGAGGLVEVVARQGPPRHVVGADAQRRHRRDDGRRRLLVLVALDEAQPGQGHLVTVRLGDGDLGRLEDDVLGEAQLDRPRRGSEARAVGGAARGEVGVGRGGGGPEPDDQGRPDGHPEAHEEPAPAPITAPGRARGAGRRTRSSRPRRRGARRRCSGRRSSTWHRRG